jgi:hypothetical protein
VAEAVAVVARQSIKLVVVRRRSVVVAAALPLHVAVGGAVAVDAAVRSKTHEEQQRQGNDTDLSA